MLAVVTGASRGIGRSICKSLSESGYVIAALSRSKDTTEQIAQEVKGHAVICDVLSSVEIQQSWSQIDELKIPLGCLVNCAGISKDGLLVHASEADILKTLQTNLVSSMLMSREFLARAIRHAADTSSVHPKSRNRSIVNIGSVVGLCGNVGQSVYATSKSGLIGFTKSLAKEYGSRGIRVNAVFPGWIDTQMTHAIQAARRQELEKHIALKRFGSPEEIASVVRFLCSADASYVTGQIISVDGGL
ncbi:mitochondrial short chain dehydrogenase/reductase family protein [Andalucia godoyi]|uniref:Mitochondrial short chain dehydrogenase/reductase family protein n=1 Tax=Andalucia godoyi TaxID=505711 RepID=A0A8K0F2Y4_ANDGO|nr:mitochondrial short chain dehydrogenase/reductase family protein [Andalucia godoyi]|eukprot:ANDGO_07608.mRNA.1 mitochondrial short chain dehydrogenase/reductase family protein